MVAKLFCRVIVAAVFGLGLIGASDAQQAVRVGSTPTGIPFTFLDTKTNQISGIMVDIINEVGKDQGFTTEITPMMPMMAETTTIAYTAICGVT